MSVEAVLTTFRNWLKTGRPDDLIRKDLIEQILVNIERDLALEAKSGEKIPFDPIRAAHTCSECGWWICHGHKTGCSKRKDQQ